MAKGKQSLTPEELTAKIIETVDPSSRIVKVVRGEDFVVNGEAKVSRCINAQSDGEVNVRLVDDTLMTYYMHKGYNPVVCKRIETGGDTIEMWALC